MSEFYLHLIHLFIGGFFLYVGIIKTNIPGFLYNLFLGISIIILLYHSYRGYEKINQGKTPWVNIIHIFLIAPILFFIGWNREKTPRYFFELLLLLAFSAIGYHGYYLWNGD
jgi:hypothetical protein